MQSIDKYFDCHRTSHSDINEHMDTLARYSEGCARITQMGVRTVVSAWAFLMAKPRKLVYIDINPTPLEHAQQLAAEQGTQLEFRQADTGDEAFEIEDTDLLFSDTWHVYEQLKREFDLHADRARRWIILHDTTTYGEHGEGFTCACVTRPLRAAARGSGRRSRNFCSRRDSGSCGKSTRTITGLPSWHGASADAPRVLRFWRPEPISMRRRR